MSNIIAKCWHTSLIELILVMVGGASSLIGKHAKDNLNCALTTENQVLGLCFEAMSAFRDRMHE